MAKKEATKKVHNDIDDLPEDEIIPEFDDESPSEVLGIDIGKPSSKAKADDDEEPDERPSEDVLAAVAAEAAEDADKTESKEEKEGDEPEEGVSVDADEPDADQVDDADELRTVVLERDGEMVEITVSAKEADALEGYMQAADTTRGQYAHLQEKYLEALHTAPAQPAAAPAASAPAEAANTRLNQMMGAIPQVVEAYTPVVNHVRDSLPEDNELRDFIEDNPVVASILAAMWDGQNASQAEAHVAATERAQHQFKNHVDGLVTNIIQADESNVVLGDSDIRDQFDSYLVSLGPIGADGNHDPGPIRQTLARDDGRWIGERWEDFKRRVALSGAKPDGADTDPKKRPSRDQARRRAIDPGSSRSGGRPQAKSTVFSKEVSDVLGAD